MIKELPQTLLGYILTKQYLKLDVVQKNIEIQQLEKEYNVKITIVTEDSKNNSLMKHLSGFSLGRYICLNDKKCSIETVKHEIGHSIQSKNYGWFYLLLIGIPSICGNIWGRIAHKNWDYEKSDKWYFSRFPEKQADILGGVNRYNAC
jgi:hypothetical protein